MKKLSNGRKQSLGSTTSTSSNQFSNGTIIDNIGDDDLKSFNFEDVTSSGSTANTEITSIRNGIRGKDLDIVPGGDDLSYQDKLFENVRRLSNTVS